MVFEEKSRPNKRRQPQEAVVLMTEMLTFRAVVCVRLIVDFRLLTLSGPIHSLRWAEVRIGAEVRRSGKAKY
jgi:hypothetical protein